MKLPRPPRRSIALPLLVLGAFLASVTVASASAFLAFRAEQVARDFDAILAATPHPTPAEVAAYTPAVLRQPRREEWGAPVGMTATFYAEPYCGRKTASGQVFDCQGFTAAHRTLPLFTRLHLQRGGKSVVVVVNDRGPWDKDAAGNYRKDLDLSLAAFAALADPQLGVIRVAVRREVKP